MNHSRLRVDAGLLFAVAAFTAQTDPRPALRGVLVEPAQRGVFLVASDGGAIAVAHDPAAECRDPIVVLIEHSGGPTHSTLSGKEAILSVDEAVVLVDDRRAARCVAIDGEYPKWRRYLPNISAALTRPSVGAELAGPSFYSAHLLARFSAASSLLGTEDAPIRFAISQPTRRAPAVVTFDGTRFAVVMQPLAVSHSDEDWVTKALMVHSRAA